MPRPYDFFLEAGRKLKPGGHLIFSVPNALHFKSRLRFLLTGYPEMFGPPSSLDKNAGRICGHIMPLGYAQFVYGLRRAGFTGIEFHADRLKRSSLVLSIVSYPLLWIGAWLNDRDLKRYDPGVEGEPVPGLAGEPARCAGLAQLHRRGPQARIGRIIAEPPGRHPSSAASST